MYDLKGKAGMSTSDRPGELYKPVSIYCSGIASVGLHP